MLKKGLGIILGILVLILGAVCWMKLRTPEEGQKVDNYRVIFEKGSYCGGTRTGCMDLKISLENGEHRKMFASADDVTGNGYHTITDDHYLLRVCLDDQELNSTAYEISADLDTQLLRIYFTNPQAVASQDPVEIKISKGTIDQEVARIPAELTKNWPASAPPASIWICRFPLLLPRLRGPLALSAFSQGKTRIFCPLPVRRPHRLLRKRVTSRAFCRLWLPLTRNCRTCGSMPQRFPTGKL